MMRDDVKCQCVGQFGPNPDCGCCGGDGTITREIDINEIAINNQKWIDSYTCPQCGFIAWSDNQYCPTCGFEMYPF